MSFSLADQHILISGPLASYTASLQAQFASQKSETATVNLDNLISSQNWTELDTQIKTSFATLDNRIDLFVLDVRTQAPTGKDPIWKMPVSEWAQDDTPRAGLQRMLSQIKLILQQQVQYSSSPFSIVLLGHRDSFGTALDQVMIKLHRDILWLHSQNSIHFLDFGFSLDTSASSIVTAITVIMSQKPEASIVSLDAIRDASMADRSARAPDMLSLGSIPHLGLKKPKAKIALSFDFDALSAFLGTGEHPDNNLADYSTGVFAGRVGARRLLHMLRKHQVADKVTWFIPGHTMETFEDTVKEIVASGAEIGLHGYAHEGAYQMTPTQERDVLVKCMEVSQRLTGKKVAGYRAPMYQLRETTIELLREFGFLYDSSLSHHDSQPYFVPCEPPVQRIDFSQPASSWLKPTPLTALDMPPAGHPLVEIPTGWNNEDMMALQYFPHVHNTNGQVDVRVVEQRWKDMFLWLWENAEVDRADGSFVFPILMHPDTSGMLHVIAMVDRFVGWLRSWGDSVEFHTFSSIAQDWLDEKIAK